MTLKEKLIAQAQELGIKTDKLTIAQLQEAIKAAQDKQADTADEKPAADPQEEKKEVPAEKESFAKSGKRSQKALREAEEEAARQARKEEATPAPVKKVVQARPRSERRSKKYKEAAKKVDKNKVYEVKDALDLIIKTSTTKFDSSVDLVVSLGVNVKQADQNVRDFVILPNGSGKKVKIAVFADEKEAQIALKAGAAIAGKEVFLQQLDKGLIDFDILITLPNLMLDLSKYAKLLGPKGLMPNPKSGTITKNIAQAVKDAQAGRVEYRVDENGLVHLAIGKVSFGAEKLQSNLEAVLSNIKHNKPSSLKGTYIKSAHLSTTMGPSLRMVLS